MCCMEPNLRVSDKTEANALELTKYLMNKYGIPVENVRTHYMVSGNTKICPNWQANDWARFKNFKNKLVGNNVIVPNPEPTPTPPPTNNGLGYLNLHPHMQSWAVYSVDGPYTINNAIAKLAPAQFGGLSYKIYEKKATDVYKIKTDSFGYVAIYAPRDNDSSITSSPIYGVSNGGSSSNNGFSGVINSYEETGRATVLISALNIRTAPSTSAESIDYYYQGESFNYVGVYETSEYFWVKYISYSGAERYVASRSKITGERYLSCV